LFVPFFLLAGCATTSPYKSNPKLQETFKATSGREAVQAGTLLMTMPLILFGGTPVFLPGEFTMGSISLVEAKSGTILWHKLYQSEAAQRYYFAKELPTFAQVKGSFRLIKMPY